MIRTIVRLTLTVERYLSHILRILVAAIPIGA